MRAQADQINLKKKKSNEDNPDCIDMYGTNESVPRSHKFDIIQFYIDCNGCSIKCLNCFRAIGVMVCKNHPRLGAGIRPSIYYLECTQWFLSDNFRKYRKIDKHNHMVEEDTKLPIISTFQNNKVKHIFSVFSYHHFPSLDQSSQ